MNLKVVHFVAIQFGILVGIASCLLFFRFESAKPRPAAEMRELATELVAAVRDQSADMVDDLADPEPTEVVPGQLAPVLSNQYSAEAVERYRAEATRLYYEQIAPRRNAVSSLAHSSAAAAAPSSAEVAQEPAVVQRDDPAPQTVAYVEPAPVIVYSQPAQFVAFSNPRRFANRCRPAPHPDALAPGPHRRRDRGGNHWSGSPEFRPARSLGVVHHRNNAVPSCRPPQGFKPRGKR